MSRPHLFMLSILICLMAVSCSPAEGDASAVASRLSDAEHILFNNPDSAKTLLLQMPVPSSSQPREHALWALLLTHARYKCYETQNDSLANIAYDYFMQTDDALHRAQTLYMKGVLCGEARQTDEEQKYLLRADLEVAKTDHNELGYVINIALSIGYAYRSLHDYALETCGKALRYAEAEGKPGYIVTSNIQYGRIYSSMGEKEETEDDFFKSIHFYQKAIDLATESKYLVHLATAKRELSAVYIMINDYKAALALQKESLALFSENRKADLSASYLVLGEIYRHLGKNDSVVYYLNRALETENIL